MGQQYLASAGEPRADHGLTDFRDGRDGGLVAGMMTNFTGRRIPCRFAFSERSRVEIGSWFGETKGALPVKGFDKISFCYTAPKAAGDASRCSNPTINLLQAAAKMFGRDL